MKSERQDFNRAPTTGDSLLVLAMVLAPIGLAVMLVSIGLLAVAGWQVAHGRPVDLPTTAGMQLCGMLAYVVGSWIAVAAVWRWSSRRGVRGEVFAFRKLTWPALMAGVAGFVIAMYGAPFLTHWLSRLTGGRGPGVGFPDAASAMTYLFLFVVTAPVCEEILYRGLLVYWLRRIGWKDFAVWLAGSAVFGANHLIPLGFVWAAVMIAFGGILFALRLRYESLSPAWLAHFLFNAQPLLIHPLIASLAPMLLPGRIP